ncbi:hypothetical protein BTVI_64030 [Pitangus sulphuratus]|nr:hypothetical protein BTVI_64030 [Pitangus sulphuratus]
MEYITCEYKLEKIGVGEDPIITIFQLFQATDYATAYKVVEELIVMEEVGVEARRDVERCYEASLIDCPVACNQQHNILSMMPYNRQYSFDQLGLRVPSVSPPNFPCSPNSLTNVAV